MEIQVWRTRPPKHAATTEIRSAGDVDTESAEAHSDGSRRPGRIRMEAGSGRWLLVVDDADRARHATLIEDIRAALGTGDCRFGTWSDSPEAGVAVEDWDAHGIRHALLFDDQPDAARGSGCVQAGELATLATSGEARRALWRQLQPLLEN